MSRRISGKIAADQSLVFPLVEHLNVVGFNLGHVRFLPWQPKLDDVFDVLQRLWQTHVNELIRGFETRTDGGYKIFFFVGYSVVGSIRKMKVIEAWFESLIDGGNVVLVNLDSVSLENLILERVTVPPSP